MENSEKYNKVATRSKFIWQIIKITLFAILPAIGAIIVFYIITLIGILSFFHSLMHCFWKNSECITPHDAILNLLISFSFIVVLTSITIIIYYIYKIISLRFSFIFWEYKIFHYLKFFPIIIWILWGSIYFFTNINKTHHSYHVTEWGKNIAIMSIFSIGFISIILITIGFIYQNKIKPDTFKIFFKDHFSLSVFSLPSDEILKNTKHISFKEKAKTTLIFLWKKFGIIFIILLISLYILDEYSYFYDINTGKKNPFIFWVLSAIVGFMYAYSIFIMSIYQIFLLHLSAIKNQNNFYSILKKYIRKSYIFLLIIPIGLSIINMESLYKYDIEHAFEPIGWTIFFCILFEIFLIGYRLFDFYKNKNP